MLFAELVSPLRISCEQKLKREQPHQRNGSAADEVTSVHEGSAAYTAYLLGQVMKMKVNSTTELNRHSRAITRMGETYTGYSMGVIHPKNWEDAYIGKNAIKQMERQIVMLEEEIKTTDSHTSQLDRQIGRLQSEMQSLKGMTIPELEAREAEVKRRIENNPSYTQDWMNEIETIRIRKIFETDELPRRKNVVGNRTRHMTAMNDVQAQRKAVRDVYNQLHSVGFDPDAATNSEYDELLRSFIDVNLSDYELEIKKRVIKPMSSFARGS
ncbi:MAG: hypothetical protein RSD95_12315 [Clostridia bacterium]